MRPVLCEWMLLWLRSRKMPVLEDDEIVDFLLSGQNAKKNTLEKIKSSLGDDHTKMLNLSHDWIASYLPFCLQKINRVNFGLLQAAGTWRSGEESCIILFHVGWCIRIRASSLAHISLYHIQ